MIRPIRVDHTEFFQVAIKTHSFSIHTLTFYKVKGRERHVWCLCYSLRLIAYRGATPAAGGPLKPQRNIALTSAMRGTSPQTSVIPQVMGFVKMNISGKKTDPTPRVNNDKRVGESKDDLRFEHQNSNAQFMPSSAEDTMTQREEIIAECKEIMTEELRIYRDTRKMLKKEWKTDEEAWKAASLQTCNMSPTNDPQVQHEEVPGEDSRMEPVRTIHWRQNYARKKTRNRKPLVVESEDHNVKNKSRNVQSTISKNRDSTKDQSNVSGRGLQARREHTRPKIWNPGKKKSDNKQLRQHYQIDPFSRLRKGPPKAQEKSANKYMKNASESKRQRATNRAHEQAAKASATQGARSWGAPKNFLRLTPKYTKNVHQHNLFTSILCSEPLCAFVTPRIYINILFLTLQQQGRLPNSLLCINKEAGRVQSNKIFRGRMFTGKPQHL
jgi:hypothetical protein